MSDKWWDGLSPESKARFQGTQAALRREIEIRDERIEKLEAKLSEQEALLAKAVWALKPYAALARHHAADSPEWGPFSSVSTCTSIMCLRNAAETLAELEGEPT